MKTTLPLAIPAVALALLLFAGVFCIKNDARFSTIPATNSTTISPDVTVKASLTGRVLDENGAPVQGASVISGKASTTTDIDGIFHFSNMSLSSRFGYVQVLKSGYFTGSRSIITDLSVSGSIAAGMKRHGNASGCCWSSFGTMRAISCSRLRVRRQR